NSAVPSGKNRMRKSPHQINYSSSNSLRAKTGFTLIEVMAALVIFSVAVVGLIINLRETMATQNRLSAASRAAMLAQNVMEEIKLTGKSELGEDQGKFKGADQDFAWRSETVKSNTAGLREITVTITWQDGIRQQDYQIATCIMS